MEVNKRKPRNSKVAAPDLHEPVGLNGLGRFSRNLAIGILLCLSLLFIYFCGAGLPEKPPQDPSTRLGCPLSWLVFMGVVYTLTFFTTDQSLAHDKVPIFIGSSPEVHTSSLGYIVVQP